MKTVLSIPWSKIDCFTSPALDFQFRWPRELDLDTDMKSGATSSYLEKNYLKSIFGKKQVKKHKEHIYRFNTQWFQCQGWQAADIKLRTQVFPATGENSPSFTCLQTGIGWKSVSGAPNESPTPQATGFLSHYSYPRAPQITMMNIFSEHSHLLNWTFNMNLDISISFHLTHTSHTSDHRKGQRVFLGLFFMVFSNIFNSIRVEKIQKNKLDVQREQKQQRKNTDSLFEFMFFKLQTRSF